MQCTPEEIEKKRQIALSRLASKRQEAQTNQKSRCHLDSRAGSTTSITVKLALICETRFHAQVEKYDEGLINAFQMMPTRHYDTESRIWDFDLDDYEMLISRILAMKRRICVERVPPFAMNCIRSGDNVNSTADLQQTIEPELFNSLMPFQMDGVSFGVRHSGRCMIADDMGLGKTFQALAIASYYSCDWPMLITTTASMRTAWERTIQQYLPSVPLMYIQHMTSVRDCVHDAHIVIVSHELLARCTDKLITPRNRRCFGVFIVDESHNFKNTQAKCTQAALKLAIQAKRVILLTGTPALSRPSELYSQLAMIESNFFGNFRIYSLRYCDGRQTVFGWNSNGCSNLKELEIILRRRFLIRRTKADVMLDLIPNKVQEIIDLDVKLEQLTAEDRQYFNTLAERYNNTLQQRDKQHALLAFYQKTASLKIPAVCSYVLRLVDNQEKFLVFAHHSKMLDAICLVLNSHNVDYIRIDGSSTAEKRQQSVDQFQMQCACQVAVLSITAANTGLTLTSANLVVFAELHWNPGILSQAESRVHRIGQMQPVHIHYLLATGTADDPIWQLLQKKQTTLQSVGFTKDSFQHVKRRRDELPTKYQCLSSNLNGSLTEQNTLDISTYFTKPAQDVQHPTGANDSDMNDDHFDELLSAIPMCNAEYKVATRVPLYIVVNRNRSLENIVFK